MKKKVCLITGGNSGIGKAAAIQLVEAGVTVIIGCRNEERGRTALEDIRAKSGSEEVELLLIDMSSQASIKKAAETVKLRHPVLDILIHNAADFDISRKKPKFSKEDVEMVWATNHIGPVLLTDLLMDELKRSEQGRVLTVSSQGLVMHPFLKVDLEDPELRESKYSVEKAYYQSKLAQVMYTYWLADKLKDTPITVNAIRVTNVKVDLDRYPDLSAIMKRMYAVKSRFSISPEEMAETYTYLALSPEMNTVSGKYFDEKRQTVPSSKYSQDKDNISQVMDLTLKYI
ncbi:SDR family NAD(P)-dependent oxidoreductase [Alkalibacterium putridalgicola]|uniref:SDR family NAD(P)-dependent oxidoreductase n=1 Tax=Alkalibacterium putridalgicola TaxID=426703 RepID=UPI0034CE8AC7